MGGFVILVDGARPTTKNRVKLYRAPVFSFGEGGSWSKKRHQFQSLTQPPPPPPPPQQHSFDYRYCQQPSPPESDIWHDMGNVRNMVDIQTC